MSSRRRSGKATAATTTDDTGTAADPFAFDLEDDVDSSFTPHAPTTGAEMKSNRGRKSTAENSSSSSSSSSSKKKKSKGTAPSNTTTSRANTKTNKEKKTKEAAADEEEEEEEKESAAASTLSKKSPISRTSDVGVAAGVTLTTGGRRTSTSGLGVSGSASTLTPSDASAVMDANRLKSVMGNKDQLIQHLQRLMRHLSQQKSMTTSGTTSVPTTIRELCMTLMDKSLTKHKSGEVKIYDACCLVDLFRLYHPISPVPTERLKDVFLIFQDGLSLLTETTHPQFQYIFHILEMFAIHKIATMLIDATNGEVIIHGLFELIFALAQYESDSTPIIDRYFHDILSDLIHGYDHLPPILLDEILRQFTPDSMKQNPGGTHLAIRIINSNKEQLEQPIVHILKRLLYDESFEDESGEVDSSLNEPKDQRSILLQLTIHCNPVVESFQRYAIDLMNHPNDGTRADYIDLYSHVFTSLNISSSNPLVMSLNQPLFEAFMTHIKDRSSNIRVMMAKILGQILIRQLHHKENMELVHNSISDALNEKDDHVRLGVIQSVTYIGQHEPDALTTPILKDVIERGKDRKVAVRLKTVECLAELFTLTCSASFRDRTKSPYNRYLVIPRKLLVLAASADRCMAITIDTLLDDKILGSNDSVESRTRLLISFFISLVDNKLKYDRERRMIQRDEKGHAHIIYEGGRLDARLAFQQHILQAKAMVQKNVNALIQLRTRFDSCKDSNERQRLDQQRHGELSQLGLLLRFVSDTDTNADMVTWLNIIFFESKDKNLIKYLKALANPLTQYSQMRLAQNAIKPVLKALAGSSEKNKKIVILGNRLSSMLPLTILPVEGVDIIYRELNDTNLPPSVIQGCLELLLVIAQTFPILLTHPGMIEALLNQLDSSDVKSQTISLILEILTNLQDTRIIQKEKKITKTYLNLFREYASTGEPNHAKLAVQCIQRYWGPPLPTPTKQSSQTSTTSTLRALGGGSEEKKDETMVDAEESEADTILGELMTSHVGSLSLESDGLLTSLAAIGQVIASNFGLAHGPAREESKRVLTFLTQKLLPNVTPELQEARVLGLELLYHHLYGYGSVIGSIGKDVLQSDQVLSPTYWLAVLLKIIKLDGDYPEPGLTTIEQKQRNKQTEVTSKVIESDVTKSMRDQLLVKTACLLLDLMHLPIYRSFFIHPPPEAVKQYRQRKESMKAGSASATITSTPKRGGGGRASGQGAAGDLSGLLSPVKSITTSSHASTSGTARRHPFLFAPILYLVQHPPSISQPILEHVIELVKRKRLHATFAIPMLILGGKSNHELTELHIKPLLLLTIRHARELAAQVERHHQQLLAAAAADKLDAATAAAAKVGLVGSKKKTKSNKKKKSTSGDVDEDEDEDEVMDGVDVEETTSVANSAMPEYILADLIYFLSYHPTIHHSTGLKPSLAEFHALYDPFIFYIEMFLDAILTETVKGVGHNFPLLLAILTKIRDYEDIRDPTNVKVYKIGELAALCVQKRAAHHSWSNIRYDQVRLSSNMWVPRELPVKEKYLPEGYQLPKSGASSARVVNEGGDELSTTRSSTVDGTPQRKRRSGGSENGPTKRRKRTVKNADEDEMSESDSSEIESHASSSAIGSAAKKKPNSASKKKSKQTETALPQRSRLQRGAKTDIKYTEAEDEDEDEEMIDADGDEAESDADADEIDMTDSAVKKSKSRSSTPAVKKKSYARSAVSDDEMDESEDGPSPPPTKKSKSSVSKSKK